MAFFQWILSVPFFLVLCMFFLGDRYKRQKRKEYGNDERWRGISASAGKAVFHYLTILYAIVVFGLAAYRFLIPTEIHLELNEALSLVLMVLLGAYAVEFFALLHYDKEM